MRKIVSLTVCVMLMGVMLSACGKSEETKQEPIDISSVDKNGFQDALRQFKFTLDGQTFDLTQHTMISDITNLGYEFKEKDDVEHELKHNSYVVPHSRLENKDGIAIYVEGCNTSDDVVKYPEAELYSIQITKSNVDFGIPGADVLQIGRLTVDQFDELTDGMDDLDAYDVNNTNRRVIKIKSESYSEDNQVIFDFSNDTLQRIELVYM